MPEQAKKRTAANRYANTVPEKRRSSPVGADAGLTGDNAKRV
ncbi:Hypothetical protein A7982_03981 [Minicystis rosea]|nr:Hypothetical protein A7982_03981 [Minicystis rosea]